MYMESTDADLLLSKPASELTRWEKEELAVLLRAQGEPIMAIAKRVGLSHPTVMGIIRRHQGRIQEIQRLEMEELARQFGVTLRQRTERYGRLIDRAYIELQNRDLSQVPTEKLVDILVRVEKIFSDLDRAMKAGASAS